MQKIILNCTALKAIALCASKADVRYYLNGVYIEATPRETRIVSTDGHRLAAYRLKADNKLDVPMASFIVPDFILKQIKPSKRSHMDYLEIEIDGDRYTFATNGIRIGFEPIDGRFPDYRRVIPQNCDRQLSQFNPELLADFQEIGRMLLNVKLAVPFVEHNSKGAARICIKGLPTFVGALMAYDAAKIEFDPEPWPAMTAEEHAAVAAASEAKAKKLAA